MRALLDTNVLVSAAIRARSRISGLVRLLIADLLAMLAAQPKGA